MTTDIARFAVLGLGAGAVYAISALGIVLIYRGSGVVNFAQGAVGMIGAFIFYDVRAGAPSVLAWIAALSYGAATGVAIHFVIMRPLRHAPPLTRLIATLGIFSIAVALATSLFGSDSRIVNHLLPLGRVVLPGDIVIGWDRLVILGTTVTLVVVLTIVYRSTRFGLATSAVAENRRATSAQGISPDLIASTNWAVGSMLAVIGAVLVVNIAGLSVSGLSVLVIFALAAALVGGFRSFPLTLIGGLLIGIIQSEIGWLQVYLTQRAGHPVVLNGWSDSVPFLVIIVVLVVRGKPLPLRGEQLERPPRVGTGAFSFTRVLPIVGATAVLAVWVLPLSSVEALSSSAGIAIVALSVVVVTGYTGQLSLAQMGLAGMGAWICATLVAVHHVSFEVSAGLGVLGTIAIGIVVGLPSLRTRGVNLAIATLGMALVLESLFLGNADRTGGLTGLHVGIPRLFGLNFDPVRHPVRYAILAIGCFTLLAVIVANLRRGRTGRRLIAVRSNERAASALGISVIGAKLYAFGLAAGIAAVGGILIVSQYPTAVFFPTFSTFASINVVVYTVIGGVGYIAGGAIAGLIAPGTFLTTVVNNWTSLLQSGAVAAVILGVILLVNLRVRPEGLASFRIPVLRRQRLTVPSAIVSGAAREETVPKALELRGVGVRFGGVTALDDVMLRVAPGEVVGLIGANGAGKTTLIDAVTGVVTASGDVVLDGVSINAWSPRRRARAGVGRTFQTLELFDTMTIRENLQTASDRPSLWAYALDLVHPGRGKLDAQTVAAIAEFELEDLLEKRPDELPFGKRREVAIARALAARPSVLLLDEPAAGLDDRETAELGRLVRRLADEWHLAVLMVEHDVQLVLDVCDRITALDQGRLLSSGTPEEIRSDPLVIAAYLGRTTTEEIGASGQDTTVRAAANPSEPVLVARELTAGYGDLPAVRAINLEVRPGEIVALLGPNGAGKSTTLLALAGELDPMKGSIAMFGAPALSPLYRRVRKGLAFVPEERSVISSLTASQNLKLGRGSPAEAVALFPELEPLLGRRAGLLSGGEQQMLTLARALAARPQLLLVDELSLGLAPIIVQRLLDGIRKAANDGLAVILVEQHTSQALAIADRAIVLRRGLVEITGSSEELRGELDRLESTYLSAISS